MAEALVTVAMAPAICHPQVLSVKPHSSVGTHCCSETTMKLTESLYVIVLVPSNRSDAIIAALIWGNLTVVSDIVVIYVTITAEKPTWFV